MDILVDFGRAGLPRASIRHSRRCSGLRFEVPDVKIRLHQVYYSCGIASAGNASMMRIVSRLTVTTMGTRQRPQS